MRTAVPSPPTFLPAAHHEHRSRTVPGLIAQSGGRSRARAAVASCFAVARVAGRPDKTHAQMAVRQAQQQQQEQETSKSAAGTPSTTATATAARVAAALRRQPRVLQRSDHIRNFRLEHETRAHRRAVLWSEFSPDNTLLASCSVDGLCTLWQAETYKKLRSLAAHTASVTQCRFCPASAQVATCSADMTVCLWDVHTGALLHTFAGHRAAVMGCAWSPCGFLVASCAADGEVIVWDADAAAQPRNRGLTTTHELERVVLKPAPAGASHARTLGNPDTSPA